MSLHSWLPNEATLSLDVLLRNGLESNDAAARIYGVVPAKILAIHDKKNQRHMQHHVQICFPWLQDESDPKLFKPWARVISPDSGNADKTGLKMSPQVGDEVLVAFEHGDPHVPYVLGQLWNKGQNIPTPTTPADHVDCKCHHGGPTLVTPDLKPKSISGDAGTNKIMYMKSRSGNLLIMDDDAGMIRLNDRTGNSAIQLEKEQILVMQRNGDVRIWAKNNVNVSCETFQIHAKAQIKYHADQSISVSAKGKVDQAIGGKIYRCPTHTENTAPEQIMCDWLKPKADGKGMEPCNTQMVLWKSVGVTKMKTGKDFTVTSKKNISIRGEQSLTLNSMTKMSFSSESEDVKVESAAKITAMTMQDLNMKSDQKGNMEGKSGVMISSPLEVNFKAGSDFVAKGAMIMLN